MTPRERYVQALLFGRPDKVPFCPGLPRESTLAAWDVPYLSLSPGDERTVIDAAWQRAHGEERPVAVLVTSPLR